MLAQFLTSVPKRVNLFTGKVMEPEEDTAPSAARFPISTRTSTGAGTTLFSRPEATIPAQDELFTARESLRGALNEKVRSQGGIHELVEEVIANGRRLAGKQYEPGFLGKATQYVEGGAASLADLVQGTQRLFGAKTEPILPEQVFEKQKEFLAKYAPERLPEYETNIGLEGYSPIAQGAGRLSEIFAEGALTGSAVTKTLELLPAMQKLGKAGRVGEFAATAIKNASAHVAAIAEYGTTREKSVKDMSRMIASNPSILFGFMGIPWMGLGALADFYASKQMGFSTTDAFINAALAAGGNFAQIGGLRTASAEAENLRLKGDFLGRFKGPKELGETVWQEAERVHSYTQANPEDIQGIAKMQQEGQKVIDTHAKELGMEKQTLFKTPKAESPEKIASEQPLVGLEEKFEQGTPPSSERKERGFFKTVEKAETTPEQLREDIKSLSESNRTYKVYHDKDSIEYAQKALSGDLDKVWMRLMDKSIKKNKGDMATGELLVQRLSQAGEHQAAAQLTTSLAEEMTNAGQLGQAGALWAKLSPEGHLLQASRVINEANEQAIQAGFKMKIELTGDQAKTLTTMVEDAQLLSGRAKAVKLAQARLYITELVPASIGRKISSIQTLLLLLNPKTLVRNMIGNIILNAGENIAQGIGAAAESGTAKVAKLFGKEMKRTTMVPELSPQWREFKRGLQEGVKEADLGIDLSQGGKYQTGRTFRPNEFQNINNKYARAFFKATNSALMKGETALNIGLRAPDRGFYESGFTNSLINDRKALGMALDSIPTAEMLERAHYEGLYRTLQDDSRFAQAFSGMKQAFNRLGIPGFGAGDIVLKFPRVPGNIVARAFDFSPAGMFKVLYEGLASIVAKRTFNQREFFQQIGRTVFGSSLYALGFYLYEKGVISAQREKDYDIQKAREESGFREYSWNWSSLQRLLHGMDASPQNGDFIMNYDWIQPNAISLAAGANSAEAIKTGDAVGAFGGFFDALLSGFATMEEQPVFRSLKKAFSSPQKSLTEQFFEFLAEFSFASFTPTLLNQTGHLLDNTMKDSYDPSYFKEGWNRAIARIPFASKTLPERISTITGEPIQRYTKRELDDFYMFVFDVFLNPAFARRYQADPELQEVLRLFERGETGQAPRLFEKKVEITTEQGEKKTLTPSASKIQEAQKYQAQMTHAIYDVILNTPEYRDLPPDVQAERIADFLTAIHEAAKIKFFGHFPSQPKPLTELILTLGPEDYETQSFIEEKLQEEIKEKEPSERAERIRDFLGTTRESIQPSTSQSFRTPDRLFRSPQ